MRIFTPAFSGLVLSLATQCPAALPPPPDHLVDFPVSYDGSAPGPFAADFLVPKPAGKNGPITVRDGHFYSGNDRVRFLGVNFCFSANFPTHEQADAVAARLARFGVNIVRFHHMDSRPFPDGIFDGHSDQLSAEALDRLDYLIAALKKNGIYADLNLHVARSFAHQLKLPGAADAPKDDKLIDLFDPTLIDAEKKYARALLTHTNTYTGNAYAAEPAVAMIEINNENSVFTWGGEKMIETLPAPFADELKGLWNGWLKDKYQTRDNLLAAWNKGVELQGNDLLQDNALAAAGNATSPWKAEEHDGARMTVIGPRVNVTKLSGPAWHLQLNQGNLHIQKDRQYTLKFAASVPLNTHSTAPRKITVSVSQAHAPWKNLGLSASVMVNTSVTIPTYTCYFTATDSDDNARLSFALGDALGLIDITQVALTPGGQQGLQPDEDFSTGDNSAGTVRIKSAETPMTPARQHDWYDFLQSLDERYFTGMYRFLRDDLHAQAPITGTIGLGALGTLSQSKMDFVDAHAYWQHPHFPGKPWDPHNWLVPNTPLVDSPAFGTMPGLAAIRVASKPFTVTEYNHPAPSDWREECIPELATIAALQDWDAVFLFAYSHTVNYERDHVNSFFDLEGDPAKMLLLPAAARIFLSGAVQPLPPAAPILVSKSESIANAGRFYYTLWPQLKELHQLTPDVLLKQQLAITFEPPSQRAASPSTHPLSWSNDGPGTGQFALHDANAAVFVGFPHGKDVPLGPLTLTGLQSPYLVATLTAANPHQALTTADHLLLTIGGRVENHNMKWNDDRTTVGTQWGKGPTQIEVIDAHLQIPPGYTMTPLDSAGKPLTDALTGAVDLSTTHTMLYRLDRSEK
ncbi:MAG: hypothetical protein ACTHN5_00810 [Phycisphaerae bacterium]